MTSKTQFRAIFGNLSTATLGVLISCFFICSSADAAFVGYQSQASFDAAIAGLSPTTTNFDALAAGTMFAPGTGPVGSGFTMTLSGLDAPALMPTVGNQFWTTSGSNYLGLDNGDTAFEVGDSVTFTFASPVKGFGLFAVGGQDVIAGDVGLTTGSTSIANGATADQMDGNGSFAFFIGLVSNDSTLIDSVTLNVLTPASARLLPISLDDITLASSQGIGQPVPEPGSLMLMLLGCGLLLLAAFIKRRSFLHSLPHVAENLTCLD